MGREAKLLLGLLATLMGVFLGVLSMKLLVPRPPAGAGPDVHADIATNDSLPRDARELVEPPALATDPAPPREPIRAPAPDPAPRRLPSRFAAATLERAPASTPDPFVSRASFAATDAPVATTEAAPLPVGPTDPARPHGTAAVPIAPLAESPPRPGSAYVAVAGDSWWSLAERAYGDGRVYRALFAWNRDIDARVSLVPGTPIDLPTRDRLEASWPALLPRP